MRKEDILKIQIAHATSCILECGLLRNFTDPKERKWLLTDFLAVCENIKEINFKFGPLLFRTLT